MMSASALSSVASEGYFQRKKNNNSKMPRVPTNRFNYASQAASTLQVTDICFHGASIKIRKISLDGILQASPSDQDRRGGEGGPGGGGGGDIHIKRLFIRSGFSKHRAYGFHFDRVTDRGTRTWSWH